MRSSNIERKTAETDIKLSLSLDGGAAEIKSGCGFLDHMLQLFAKHSGYGMKLSCKGDTYVDYHHTAEDIGICLGAAIKEALGDKRGITRYGDMLLPMDEALILTAIDISGRSMLVYNVDMPTFKVGDFDTELIEEFFSALVREAGITLHIKMLDGKNTHHVIEGIFKSFARAMAKATAIDEARAAEIPSTKGVL